MVFYQTICLQENKPGTETTITEAGTEPGAGEGSDSAQDSETEQAVSDSDSEGDVSDSTLEEDVSIVSIYVLTHLKSKHYTANTALPQISNISYDPKSRKWEPDTRAVNTRAVDARVVDTRAAISQKVDTLAAVSYHIIIHIYMYIYIDTV